MFALQLQFDLFPMPPERPWPWNRTSVATRGQGLHQDQEVSICLSSSGASRHTVAGHLPDSVGFSAGPFNDHLLL